MKILFRIYTVTYSTVVTLVANIVIAVDALEFIHTHSYRFLYH